jgi:aspartyl-tRNA(Asn)/glutamyl-tRNA(Gln) amidotransferase subunit C
MSSIARLYLIRRTSLNVYAPDISNVYDTLTSRLLTAMPLRVRLRSPMAEDKITLEMVRYVARLARLELTEAEEQSLRGNLNDILVYIDKLNELDTKAVEPTTQVGEAGTPLRDDRVTNAPAPEAMLANAPEREGTFFKVPKIIE